MPEHVGAAAVEASAALAISTASPAALPIGAVERDPAPTMRNCYIVDDDEVVRRSLQSLVAGHCGALVQGFGSGDAFLAAMADLAPGVVILDLDLPGRNGMDVLDALRQDARHFMAIMLTGYGSIHSAVRALKKGAVEFLEKPCSPDSLLDALDSALLQIASAQSRPQDDLVAKEKLSRLSRRETEVLQGLVDGWSNRQIGEELALSRRTVEIYRANMMDRLEVDSLSAALRLAFAAGMTPTIDAL